MAGYKERRVTHVFLSRSTSAIFRYQIEFIVAHNGEPHLRQLPAAGDQPQLCPPA